MSTPIQHLTLLVVAIAGWLQRDQQAAIVYLLEENRVLKARLRRRKLRLTDADRRLLAVKGKALGRELLAEVAGIVTPETLLVWYRTPDCRVDHVWRYFRVNERFRSLPDDLRPRGRCHCCQIELVTDRMVQ